MATRLAFFRYGTAVSWHLSFDFPAKRCDGTISGEGQEADGGELLVGTLLVQTTCSDHDEPGTFSFRPTGRRDTH